jgi:hypothetical protein
MGAERNSLRAAVGAVMFAAALDSRADPNDYIRTPMVTQGEREIDFAFGASSRGEEVDSASAAKLGMGYGVTNHWFTELMVQYAREGSSGMKYDTPEWENVLTLAEAGEWPIDVGLISELEKPRDPAEGWKLRVGTLLQRDFGPIQLNLNLLVRQAIHTRHDHTTWLDYQFQAKYRYREAFEFGVQALSDVGPWDPVTSSAKQLHRAGPAVFGRWPLGDGRALSYNAGLLFGTTDNSYDHTLRLQIEYEF